MNRTDFQGIATLRVNESQALLDSGHYPGAYYLIGYAVECALKACIAKQIRQYDFPDKKLANKVYTHDLEDLVKAAGLEPEFDHDRSVSPDLELNWAVVRDWSEEARYDAGITEAQARELYSACTGRNGVLPWVMSRW